MIHRFSLVLSSALLLTAVPLALFASGEEEGGAVQGGTPVEGEPYVDHIYQSVAAYEQATGNTIDGFNESPLLAARVAEGTLPPVEERLPQDVMVVRPRDYIGVYGGTFQAMTVSGEIGNPIESAAQYLATFGPDTRHIVPNVIRAWELSDDATTLTLTLRRGMKWSDGDSFDMEDFVFEYEDIIADSDVTERPPRAYRIGGSLVQMDVVDPLTVRYTFPVPAHSALSQWSLSRPFAPAHYLKQWHPRHNDGAQDLAKSQGYDQWWEAIQAEYDGFRSAKTRKPETPVLVAWRTATVRMDAKIYERNPYFWKVDIAGNQLPYIDGVFSAQVENLADLVSIRAMAGELDLATWGLKTADYPIYKRNEESGGYTVGLFDNNRKGFAAGFVFNYTHKDPVLRELYNDIRFRQALSLAVDRDDMSETLFLGLTRPHTAPVPNSWTGFEDWFATYYAEFDLDRANALLDEIGLEWDSNEQWRLRPDGEPLLIEGLWVTEWFGWMSDLMDLVKEHWARVGIRMEPKFVPEELGFQRAQANELELMIGETATTSEFRARRSEPITLVPPWHWVGCCAMSSVPWRQWLDSDGAEGMEPPQDIKEIWEVAEAWRLEKRGTERYQELSNQLIRRNVEGQYFVGLVSMPPTVVILNNRVANMERDKGVFASLPPLMPFMPDTWFLIPESAQ